MQQILDFLVKIWDYFASNILTQPAYMIGFIVLLGYILERKHYMNQSLGF